MPNPIRRTESPASTALLVIEAHTLFHLVTVIVDGKAMPGTPSMLDYVLLCQLCYTMPTTVYAILLLL